MQVDSEALGLLTTVGLVPGQPARVRRDGVRVIAWRDGSQESTGVAPAAVTFAAVQVSGVPGGCS